MYSAGWKVSPGCNAGKQSSTKVLKLTLASALRSEINGAESSSGSIKLMTVTPLGRDA